MKGLVKAGFLIICSIVMLAGCGGGGGGGSSSGGGGVVTATITGIAAKGAISGGTVTAYKIVNGAIGAQVGGPVTTAENGAYRIIITDYTGPLMLKVTGGTYQDESVAHPTALNKNKDLATEMPAGLRAVIPNALGTVIAAITPITELATQYGIDSSYLDTIAHISTINTMIGAEFGITDILTTQPVRAVDLPVPAPATYTQSQEYTRNLVAISGLASPDLAAYLSLLSTELRLNGGHLTQPTKDSINAAMTPVIALAGYSSIIRDPVNDGTGYPNDINILAYDSRVTSGSMTFSVSGTATLTDSENQERDQLTVTSQIGSISATYPFKAFATLHYTGSSPSGSVTVSASSAQGQLGEVPVSFITRVGTKTYDIFLTAGAVAGFGGLQVSRIVFDIIAGTSTNVVSLVNAISGVFFNSVNQRDAVTARATKDVGSQNGFPVSSVTPLLTVTYAYSPLLPTFTVVPVGVVTLQGGSTVTLTSSDFVIIPR
jgi:hypothetical protein